MLAARFHNLSSQPLRNLDCLRDAPPFCDEPRDIWTRSEIAPFFKRLDSNTNCYFFNFCDVLLPFHARLVSLHRTTALGESR